MEKEEGRKEKRISHEMEKMKTLNAAAGNPERYWAGFRKLETERLRFWAFSDKLSKN
jgi:hypothetical protein